jgi:dsDNA-specific endonuclease/ATPase MutS2
MPDITMTLNDYQMLMNEKEKLEKQVVELIQQKASAELADPDGRVQHLVETVKAGREVIRFAVAHLAPETVRGWPHEQLKLFADLLETSPGAPHDYKEMAIDLRDFALQAKRLEEARRSGNYYPTVTLPDGTTPDLLVLDSNG